jgi:hypothetical protein
MTMPALTKRLVKGTPLTATEGDTNWDTIKNAHDALEARVNATFNADGTLKRPQVLPLTSSTGNQTYAVTTTLYSPASLADLDGFIVAVLVDFTNTSGAATLQFNAFTAKGIRKFRDQTLDARDIQNGGRYLFMWKHAADYWELLNPSTTGRENYLADTGTSSAIQLTGGSSTTFQEPSAYYDGYTVLFKAANTCVATPTLRVGTTLLAVATKRRTISTGGPVDSDLRPGDIVAGGYYRATYSGSGTVFYIDPVGRFEHTDSGTLPSAANFKRTFAHNMGRAPEKVRVVIVANATDQSYVAGEVVGSETVIVGGAAQPAIQWYADATSIHVISNDGTYRAFKRDGTGGFTSALDATKWNYKVIAEA